jgi:hypothetical protein
VTRAFASGGSTVFGAAQHVRSDGGQCEPPSRLKISDARIQDEKQERHMAQMVLHVVSKTVPGGGAATQ